jgi:hypothetical protein
MLRTLRCDGCVAMVVFWSAGTGVPGVTHTLRGVVAFAERCPLVQRGGVVWPWLVVVPGALEQLAPFVSQRKPRTSRQRTAHNLLSPQTIATRTTPGGVHRR